MLTNFSWQLLLSRPIRLWISESCRFWHKKKKSLSSPLCAAKFTLPLSFTTVGRVMPLFFLLIPLRLTLSVEWEELIIFSYTNPKRCEFNLNTPAANTYESWLLYVDRKGDRVCRVWLKIQLRSVSVPASVSSTHPIGQLNGFWSDLDQDPTRSYHSRKKMLPLPLLPPVKHKDWSRSWGRRSCSSVVFLLDATRETKENMIENREFQCVGEHGRGTGAGGDKPFPSRLDPSICVLDRSGSDPSTEKRQVKIETSTQFQ